jgi:hypothetical protein
VVAEGDGRRGVVAVEDGQAAIVAQHSGGFGQRTLRAGDVGQRRVEDDGVERLAVKRQLPAVGLLEGRVRQLDRERPGLVEERRGRVDADHGPDVWPAREHPRQHPGPAANFQDARMLAERDVGEEGTPHRLLLRIGAACLEDAGQALLHRGVELGDGSIDVRHDSPPCTATANTRTREAPHSRSYGRLLSVW